MGRLSKYTPELAAEICDQLELGKSLRAICKEEAMPSQSMVFRWLDAHAEFREQYARARNIGLDAMADDLLDIADDGTNDYAERVNPKDGSTYQAFDAEHVQRSKLRVDTRKWYLSKLAPKRYGDKLAVEHTGELSIVERLAAGRKRTGQA